MSDPDPRLVPLAWDAQHFGFPVARVEGDAGAPDDLARLLAQARADRVRLVYWNGAPGAAPPAGVLDRFAGALVDRKLTLTRALDGEHFPPAEGAPIREWPKGPAPDALVRLALASGARSRFRVDPRCPPELFTTLYAQWIQRSTSGEIADAVLVAHDPGRAEPPLGLITVAVKAGVGHIGLLAVDERARGAGWAPPCWPRATPAWPPAGAAARAW